MQQLETQSPDSVKLIMGDFNSCDLKDILPHYHQYIGIPTRVRTLDKCYRIIIKTYKAHTKSGQGSSDHDMVHLVLVYKQKLKQEKPQVKQVREWTNNNTEALRASRFEWTGTFTKFMTTDMAAVDITDYIKF